MVVMACLPAERGPLVRPGIDVLLTDSSHLLAGRRVGLLSTAAAVDRDGVGVLERLLADGVQVTAIFSPEHGYRVRRDGPIGDEVDSATGLPIHSLYGTRRRPTAEALATVDIVLMDLVDIGGRTYTYVSTMLNMLEAAGDAGIPVVVLDRPNPIGGDIVQGPRLDPTYASFVGRLPLPARHGMTLAEQLRFGVDHLALDADLRIVPVAGWARHRWFDETGLPWVNPSPSMPSLESATHYPGLVIFEATAVSVGRGTPVAFQLLGAPWLDIGRVLEAVGAQPGVEFDDTTVTPVAPPDGKFADEPVPAIRLRVTDRRAYDPVATGVQLLTAIGAVHPAELEADSSGFARLWGSPRLWNAIRAGRPAGEIVDGWAAEVAAFTAERQPFLLYP